MIAVDTNILVYAHREETPWHQIAKRSLARLAAAGPWGLPWPCVHEFLAIVTHPRIFNPPTPLDRATKTVASWLASPSVVLLAEREDYFEVLEKVLAKSRVLGPRIHDARIAALCIHHGVDELWTQDRDFSRFDLVTTNPLRGAAP